PRVETGGLVTDTNGFWLRPHFPAEVNSIWVEIVEPGGARTQFTSGGRNMGYYGAQVGQLDVSELQATRAVFALKEGTTVHGIVVDEAGKPIASAKIRERGVQIMMSSQPYGVTTGTDGRFELPHRNGGQLLLSAEADGYAIRSLAVSLGKPTAE